MEESQSSTGSSAAAARDAATASAVSAAVAAAAACVQLFPQAMFDVLLFGIASVIKLHLYMIRTDDAWSGDCGYIARLLCEYSMWALRSPALLCGCLWSRMKRALLGSDSSNERPLDQAAAV